MSKDWWNKLRDGMDIGLLEMCPTQPNGQESRASKPVRWMYINSATSLHVTRARQQSILFERVAWSLLSLGGGALWEDEKIYIQPSDIRLRPFFSVMSISTTVSTLKIGFQWEGKFRYISPFPLLDCPFALSLSISFSVCQVMTHRMVLLHFHLFFLIV